MAFSFFMIIHIFCITLSKLIFKASSNKPFLLFREESSDLKKQSTLFFKCTSNSLAEKFEYLADFA
jgi:hypothetical protein